MDEERRKALGAFYTDEEVVRFLVNWSLVRWQVDGGQGEVLDPSCGDGRFLAAALRQGAVRVVGCDLAEEAVAATRERLKTNGKETNGRETQGHVEILACDFFDVDPRKIAPVATVLGNPPYIRYQRFAGEQRRRALAAARSVGVELTRLTSSWAPFLLHALRFLRPGGDLAVVVPGEILRTRYGRDTLSALVDRFARICLVVFERNFFEDAQEEACLLLARGLRGAQPMPASLTASVNLVSLESTRDLAALGSSPEDHGRLIRLDPETRFAEAFLPAPERHGWQMAKRHPLVRPLSEIAQVTNGYVTGANNFFHRSRAAIQAAGYPLRWLHPAARGSKSLSGLFFGLSDVDRLENAGRPHHLFVPRHDLFDQDPEALAQFVAEGEAEGIHERFKCRVRSPWWAVPGLQRADILVSYMIGRQPRAVVNRADAFYTNSLHGLRLKPGIEPELLAMTLHSSLSLLSFEIEGRTYGGGVLKLEPRELDRVLVAWPRTPPERLAAVATRVDGLLRDGLYNDAVDLVDEKVLTQGLGMNGERLKRLQRARRRLMERRTRR